MGDRSFDREIRRSIPWWQIDFGEEARLGVLSAIDARSFSMGSVVAEMEKRFAQILDVKHCIAVTNGTSALLLSLLALEIKPNDEVVIQDRTWIAAANVARLLGATVKLADVNSPPLLPPNITKPPLASIESIRNLVTPKTKAIIISHMNGRVFSQLEIEELRGLSIPVIEDSAQALGSKDAGGKNLGTVFQIGCFSLAMTKLISAGQGGFVVTNDDTFAQRMRMARLQGVEQVFDPAWGIQGLNLRMTDLHASIALSQIKRLDEIFSRQRQVLRLYSENLVGNPQIAMVGGGCGLVEIGPYVECVVRDRQILLQWLSENGVEARPFYPSISSAKYINTSECRTTNSELWGNHGLYLPSGPGISDEEIRAVCQLINEFYSNRTTEPTTTL